MAVHSTNHALTAVMLNDETAYDIPYISRSCCLNKFLRSYALWKRNDNSEEFKKLKVVVKLCLKLRICFRDAPLFFIRKIFLKNYQNFSLQIY